MYVRERAADSVATPPWTVDTRALRLDAATWRTLLERLGPSLGLWRAAEVAALREQMYARPLLDLGCGDGLVTSLAIGHADLGLDPNPRALQRAEPLGLYDRVMAAPVESSDLPAAAFSTVVSNSVLEHLPALDDVLRAVARVLRPGGRLIFTVPTATFSSSLALPLRAYARWRNRQLGHANLWPVRQWSEHLTRAGLHVESVRPYLRPALVRAWDALELIQQVWIAHRRLVSVAWRRIPPSGFARLAARAARLDLSSGAPGGGCLVVARKW